MKRIFFFLLLLFAQIVISQENKIDFGSLKQGHNWAITNDGVMGGLSQGETWMRGDGMVFSGKVSLRNNGGFSSFKSPFKSRDLSKCTKIVIRYRAKGYKMGFTIEMDRRWFLPYYKRDLEATAWKWVEEEILFSEFVKYSVGRKRPGTPTVDELKNILRVGFITNEKRAGKFKMEIDYIEFR